MPVHRVKRFDRDSLAEALTARSAPAAAPASPEAFAEPDLAPEFLVHTLDGRTLSRPPTRSS